jgi:demethylmenaquinone methyltransferase/2-methoxy-6-polyprenyl-1,4-benzoquinol methylase
MYEKVAFRYDFLNRVATFGLDGGWRRRAAELLPKDDGMTLVDICAGTGEMTRELARRVGHGSLILALDFSYPMLSQCREKIAGAPAKVAFVMGRGQAMPIATGSADAACCAFALRNLESVMDGFLGELFRVLKPGGKAVLLETGRPTAPVFRQAHMFYLARIVAMEGRLFTGDGSAYRYLAESVRRFWRPDEFCHKLRAAGFCDVGHHNLSFGIATIFTARKTMAAGRGHGLQQA